MEKRTIDFKPKNANIKLIYYKFGEEFYEQACEQKKIDFIISSIYYNTFSNITV